VNDSIDRFDAPASILSRLPRSGKALNVTARWLLDRWPSWKKNCWLSEHTYRETAGSHDWIVWRRYLAAFLPLLFTKD
jgi:hypothetical protein